MSLSFINHHIAQTPVHNTDCMLLFCPIQKNRSINVKFNIIYNAIIDTVVNTIHVNLFCIINCYSTITATILTYKLNNVNVKLYYVNVFVKKEKDSKRTTHLCLLNCYINIKII